MTEQRLEPAAIACTLEAGDLKTRLAWLATLNTASLRDSHRDDLRLELVYAADARDQVVQMVRGEEACCGFLSFEISDEPDAVRVIIKAPEAARDAATMVFEPFRSKAPNRTSCGCSGSIS